MESVIQRNGESDGVPMTLPVCCSVLIARNLSLFETNIEDAAVCSDIGCTTWAYAPEMENIK